MLFCLVFKEYCEAETFRAACPMGHVIVIRHAQYGRMRIGRCVIRDYGYVGCSVNVLTHMDAMCSGNQICDVRIPDPILDRVNICPKDFKTYLEIGYVCIAGIINICWKRIFETSLFINGGLMRRSSPPFISYIFQAKQYSQSESSSFPNEN